jgi:hypothetical protein
MSKTGVSDIKFTPLPVDHYPALVIVQKSPTWQGIHKPEAEETKQQLELRW